MWQLYLSLLFLLLVLSLDKPTLFVPLLWQWSEGKPSIKADTRWDWWLFFFGKPVRFTPWRTVFNLLLVWLLIKNVLWEIYPGTSHLMRFWEIYHFQFQRWNNLCVFLRAFIFDWSFVLPILWWDYDDLSVMNAFAEILGNIQLIGPIPLTLSQIPNLKIM